MAAARSGDGLKSRFRRPPPALRVLRSLAALSLLGLVGLVAYEGLRAAGFRFRRETHDELPARRPGRVEETPAPRGPDAPRIPPPTSPAAPSAPGLPAGSATEAPAAAPEAPLPGPAPLELPVGRGAIGQGEFAAIDFEAFGDGRPFCTNCPVSDQWRPQGLVVSFRSWSARSTLPYVLDARNFLPPGSSKHALGPALAGERGLEVGVLRLDFPGRPRKVAFTLYGPDLIRYFSVQAWSGGEPLPPSATARALEIRYNPAGRGLFRAERILVEAPGGVDGIGLDGWGPPGHVLLVDNLGIDP